MSDPREKSSRTVLGRMSKSPALDIGVPQSGHINLEETHIGDSRFFELFEFSPIPFVIISEDKIKEVNISACQLFGLGIGKIEKRSLGSFFLSPEKIEAFLEKVEKSSNPLQAVFSLISGERVKLHAKFLQKGKSIQVGLTTEVPNALAVSRLKHVMLAAGDAICIYGSEKQLSSNKAARILLRGHDSGCLADLLFSLQLDVSVNQIDASLEVSNLWRRPVSLDGASYQVAISHICSEFSATFEYLVKLSPLKTPTQTSLSQPTSTAETIPDIALTPLTVIASAASLLKVIDPKSESFSKVLSLLENNVDVLSSMVGGFDAVPQRSIVFDNIPIVAVLSDAVARVRKITEMNIEIDVHDPRLLISAEREIAVNVLFELLLKCTRKSSSRTLKIVLDESASYLAFNIHVIDEERDEPEIYLKKTREILTRMGADVYQLPAKRNENFRISVIFRRGKEV